MTSFPLGSNLPAAPAPHSSAANHTATIAPAKPAGAYRPPHARGSATPLHFKREDEGGAAHVYTNGASSSTNGNGLNGLGKGRGRREVPGAIPIDAKPTGAAPGGGVSLSGTGGDESPGLSKAALKNKKKREAKKAKEAAAAAGDGAQQGSTNGNGGQQLIVDGNPVPIGPVAERQPREGNRPHRGDRSRSRSNRPPHERHNQGDRPHGDRGQGNRRSKSRNPDRGQEGDNNKHQRGQSGDVRNHPQGNTQISHQHTNNTNSGANNSAAGPAGDAAPPSAPLVLAKAAPGLVLTVPTGVSGPLSPVPGTPSTAEEKKLRGLHKKLRAIEELKQRLAVGEKLEETQLKKIATEGQVKRELELMGGA